MKPHPPCPPRTDGFIVTISFLHPPCPPEPGYFILTISSLWHIHLAPWLYPDTLLTSSSWYSQTTGLCPDNILTSSSSFSNPVTFLRSSPYLTLLLLEPGNLGFDKFAVLHVTMVEVQYTGYCLCHKNNCNYHSWASASRPMLPALAFWHPVSQSSTGAFRYRTGSSYPGTGVVPAMAFLFIPGPDWVDGQSGIPALIKKYTPHVHTANWR